MRPIKLTMTAFGPFAGTEQIDFELLGNNPLFLINGPTGAGKTTILDAICVALYGKTTGNERQPDQMRCDHAAPDSIARVELLFELQGKRYRVLREPDQQRPKLRGEGFTRHNANAELYRVDEQGVETVLVAAKVTEATAAIEQMTGLTVDQFRQVMVLPQGEFRRLLMADSSEREKVFGQLFQTQIYKRIEFVLKDQAAALRKRLDALGNQQKGILDSADLEDEKQLSQQLEQQQPLLAAALNTKQATQLVQQQCSAALTSGRQLQADFARLATLEDSLQELIKQQALINQRRQQLANARQAQLIQGDYRQLQSVEQSLQRAALNRQQCLQISEDSAAQLLSARQLFEQANSRQAEIDATREQQSRLKHYLERVAVLQKARQQLAASRREVAATQSAAGLQQTKLATLESQLQQSNQHLAELSEQLKGLPAAQLAVLNLQQQRKQRRELQAVEQQLAECRQQQSLLDAQLYIASGELVSRERDQQQLELRWHRGQAALLASQLQSGSPCPVCGSEQHPHPASSSEDIPDQSQRDAANIAVDSARQQQQHSQHQSAVLTTRQQHYSETINALSLELGANARQPLQQLEGELEQQQQQFTSLQKLQIREQQLGKQLQQFQQQQLSYSQQLADLEQVQARAQTAQQLAQQSVHTAEAEIPELLRVEGALQQAIRESEQHLAEWLLAQQQAKASLEQALLGAEKANANLANAEQQYQQAQQQLSETRQHWLQRLAASSFADVEGFQLAVRSDTQLAALQQQLQEYDQQRATAEGAVSSLQQALAGSKPPLLAALATALDTAEQALMEAEQQHALIDKRVSQLLDIQKKLHHSTQQLQGVETEYSLVGTLSDVANGKTGNRISLQRFVLSVLLDDVLVEASQRLKSMSKGRYELYRQQQKAKGAGASGLELMVEDAYNGKQRPVATLSGGESFMAALSLALGLSDVVQAYAGGIQLDTLFIDEGFGSLDPESLDLAVNTLMDLQASGRMVGIISHVPELKERINVRLDVHSDRQGSRIQVVSS